MEEIKYLIRRVLSQKLVEDYEKFIQDRSNKFRCLKTLEGHSHFVSVVLYSPDGKYIVSGSVDRTIKIWGEE